MTKDINFKAYDTSHADTTATDGETLVPYNIIDQGNGAYSNVPTPTVLATLPEGYSAVAVHTVGERRRLIITDTSGMLYTADYRPQATHISHTDMAPAGYAGRIIDIRQTGSIIAAVTSRGLIFLIPKDDTYLLIDEPPEMPVIEFGLQKAGNLTCSDKIAVASSGAATAIGIGQTGSSASRVHPSASGIRSEVTDISKALMDIYKSAVVSQCTAKGYVDRPFMIRYALRLYDGTHIMASPQVLMLPTVLPPRLCVSATQTGDSSSVISVDLSANSYYQLRQRILSDSSPLWEGIIAAVDIFVSRPTDTYEDEVSSGYITDYRSVADAVDSGGFNRGRPTSGGVSRADGTVYDGHYSEGDDCYTDHYIDSSLMHKVWHLTPNHRLQEQMMSTDTFYRIASIPYSTLARSEAFTPVELLSSDFSELTGHLVLRDDILCSLSIKPTAIKDYGNQLVIAADSLPLPKPMPLRAMSAYSGSASAEGSAVTVSVYIRHQGKTYRTSTICQGMAANLREAFPRYIYCPYPEAYMMSFTQDGVTRHISLTPHETMPGSYWWGGLGNSYTPEASNGIPHYEAEGTVPCNTVIYTSIPDNPLCLSPMTTSLGPDRATAMHSAMQAPRSGNFGQYPIYAFTTGGIWLLQYTESKQAITSARMISDDVPHSPTAITPVNDTVAYLSDGRLMAIDGSQTKCLSRVIRHMTSDISRLPHHHVLLSEAYASQIAQDIDDMLSDAVLIYSHKHEVLTVGNPKEDYSLVYSLASGSWATSDTAVRGRLCCCTDSVWNDGRSRLVTMGEYSITQHGLLVTRPIKVDSPAIGKDVCSVEVIGDFSPGHVKTAVYGADSIRRWHLAASSQTSTATDHSSRRYRYICVAVVTHLEPREYITGLQICY